MAYATLSKVHERLNIADSVTAPDTKIASYIAEADGYVDTQIALHAVVPVSADAELIGLANGLAAAIYVYWTSPSRPAEGLRNYKQQIQDYIRARYGKKNPSGLSGSTWGKTASGLDGTEE